MSTDFKFYTRIRLSEVEEKTNLKIVENDDNLYLESDTVNIIENFRKHGYYKILLNRNCIVRHL